MMDDFAPPKRYPNEKKWPQHPAGSAQVVFVDGIRLGEKYNPKWGKVEDIVALVFQSSKKDPESGERYELKVEFTYSDGEKSNLPKFLAKWTGKPSGTDAERTALLISIPSLVGTNGIGTITHTEDGERVWVNLVAVAPLLDGMTLLKAEGYTRKEYWAKRKAKFAEEVEAHRKSQEAKPAPDFSDVPPALDEEDPNGLPF